MGIGSGHWLDELDSQEILDYIDNPYDTPPIPAPIDVGGGGGGGHPDHPDSVGAETRWQDQLDWLNSWLQSDTFEQYGGLPYASGPGSFFSDTDYTLDLALNSLGYNNNANLGFIDDVYDYDGGGGGGGGGGGAPNDAVFSQIDIDFPGAPEWWRAMAPDVNNPISNFQTISNLMIPLLSPEDQRTVSSNLFQSDPKQFAQYDPTLLAGATIASQITPEIRQQFFTGKRAETALGAFDELLAISGKTSEDFGPGYNFMRTIADQISDFKLTSGATQLSEVQQNQMLAGLDPLLAQTSGDQLRAFGPLARSFANPFFSAGALTGKTKNRFGDLIRPRNPRYY